jgi:hypothetical protein
VPANNRQAINNFLIVFKITKPFLHFGLRFYAGRWDVLLYFHSSTSGWNDYFSKYKKAFL